MARVIEVKAKGRSKLADKVLKEIEIVGEDKIISIINHGPDGKFAGGGMMANYVAHIFIKG